jgi:hypothetical protein
LLDVQFFAGASLEKSDYNVICSHREAEMPSQETYDKHYKNKCETAVLIALWDPWVWKVLECQNAFKKQTKYPFT